MQIVELQHPDELIDQLSPLDSFHSSDLRAIHAFQQNAIEATKAMIVNTIIATMVTDPVLRENLSKSIESFRVLVQS
jgi:hypothetical protein